MKMNLIKARAELNRLPSRIRLDDLKERMAVIRAKWNVETAIEFELQRIKRDGCRVWIVGNDLSCTFELVYYTDSDVKKMIDDTGEWKRIDGKNLWMRVQDNGNIVYRSYRTIIGVFNATEGRLYEDACDYSATTNRHKNKMAAGSGVSYYEGRIWA